MYEIKAHEVIYKGAHFRSKNEARRYIFMKELGWNIEYEPIIEGLKNWIPDFIIFGKNAKILVEAKPYQTSKDFETNYAKEVEKKIHNSGWTDLGYDAVFIMGSTLNLGNADCGDDYSFIGGKIFRECEPDEYNPNSYRGDFFAYTDYPSGNVGVCDELNSYHDIINDAYDGSYSLSKKNYDLIDTAWNKAGTEMRYVKRIA